MKNVSCFLIAIILTFTVAVMCGYKLGIDHAIYDSEMFVVDLPDRNEYGGFDEDEITVYLTIDSETHEYGCCIG